MRHMSTINYGQEAASNVAPAHRSVLELVTSWNSHSTEIGTIIEIKSLGILFM